MAFDIPKLISAVEDTVRITEEMKVLHSKVHDILVEVYSHFPELGLTTTKLTDNIDALRTFIDGHPIPVPPEIIIPPS